MEDFRSENSTAEAGSNRNLWLVAGIVAAAIASVALLSRDDMLDHGSTASIQAPEPVIIEAR